MSVPLLSLGSWHTFDRMNFADSVAMFRHAIDRGITLFDVGVYGAAGAAPASTDVIFSAMVRAADVARDEYQLSAKLWIDDWTEGGLPDQLAHALFRNGSEYADIIVLGDVRDPSIELDALMRDVARLLADGMTRAWGVNNWSAAAIAEITAAARALGVQPPSIAQLKYSVARRSIADGEPFAALFADGLGLQPSDVLEGGILAGKTATAREIGRDPGMVRERIRRNVPRLLSIAQDLGTTAAALSIAFTLTHTATVSTLVGVSRISQLDDAISALDLLADLGGSQIREAVAPLWVDAGVVEPTGP